MEDVDGPEQLGMEVVRWDIATTVAGGLIGVNPFDESGFQETKDVTKSLLSDGSHQVPAALPIDAAARSILAATDRDGYVAILAWVDRTEQNERALGELRATLAEQTQATTILSYGPRYLHATGQLHRSGRGCGAFLHIFETPSQDLNIPHAPFTFGTLFAAQMAADAITLHSAGVPLVRVEAGTDLSTMVHRLIDAVSLSAVVAGDA